MNNFEQMRFNMVEGQIRANDIHNDALLHAMLSVRRELYLPEHKRHLAYSDAAIALNAGRVMRSPLMQARMLNHAMVKPSDIILMVGAGGGYMPALAAKISALVIALEQEKDFIDPINDVTETEAIDNIMVVEGVLAEAHLNKTVKKQAPFDVIIMTGGVRYLPPSFEKLLADGGRMLFLGLGNHGVQELIKQTKQNGHMIETHHGLADGALLPGFEKASEFTL